MKASPMLSDLLFRSYHLVFRSLAVAFLAFPALADQTTIPNYDTARDRYVYDQLYPHGGWTLYCGKRWHQRSKRLNVEHVYPASWMKETAGCAGETRTGCRKKSERFNRMEADLHNLYVALAEVNRARSNYRFGIVGEDDEGLVWGGWCDFETDRGARLAEPRRIARGNVARAIFYMHTEYGLPVEAEMGALLLCWHRDDPPSAHERRRNNTIEALQGTRNRFVDVPKLAETLGFEDGRNLALQRVLWPLATWASKCL